MPRETPTPGSAEALGLADEYDAAATRLFKRAQEDPSLTRGYYNKDGERCPPPVCAAGHLHQSANTLRGDEPFIR